jgi:D-alanine-D-alanine ligase-like ATP-grasp enzyme
MLLEIALHKGYQITFYPSSPSTESGVARCEKNGKVFFLKSTCTMLTSSLGVFAAENKCLTYSILRGHGVNVPDYHAILSNAEVPKEAFAMLTRHKELVVKPAQTNHGDGITIGIQHDDRLREAVDYARRYCKLEDDIIIQQQVYGKEYRFLVVNGKTIAVAHRRPPRVVGDGVATIKELIEQINLDPRRKDGHSSVLTKISLEDVLHYGGKEFLARIPGVGEVVEVLATSNLSRGGEAVDCTDAASRELKDMAARAAESCFLGVSGVDIMTNDITSSDVSQSYVIEVNLTPGIRMHQYPSEGTPRDVAAKIFRAVEKTAVPIGRPRTHVGRVEQVKIPELHDRAIPARIDSGATISSLWVSHAQETPQGLEFILFDTTSPLYTGERHTVSDYSTHIVSSSMGQVQTRYKIQLIVSLKGRKVRASFTLADRSTQAYPILIGRNILRNKYIVDVAKGSPDKQAEQALKLRKATATKARK